MQSNARYVGHMGSAFRSCLAGDDAGLALDLLAAKAVVALKSGACFARRRRLKFKRDMITLKGDGNL